VKDLLSSVRYAINKAKAIEGLIRKFLEEDGGSVLTIEAGRGIQFSSEHEIRSVY